MRPCLCVAVEVVDGQRRHDDVKRAGREGILQACHVQLDAIAWQHRAGPFEHLVAGVEPDQDCCGVACEHAPCRLAGPRSEVQYARRADARGADRLVLQALVVGHLAAHQVEVAGGIPMKLRHARNVPPAQGVRETRDDPEAHATERWIKTTRPSPLRAHGAGTL